jgi:type II secretory pathway pseudopilin PulG
MPDDGVTIMPRFVHGRLNRVVGFSLFELLVVVAIGLLVTAIGLPLMNNVIANMRLRASMTSVSGLLQNTRMAAVKQNKIMTAKYTNLSSPPYSLIYYIKLASDSSVLATSDPQVEMEAPIVPSPAPAGPGAPAAIAVSVLGFTPQGIDASSSLFASFNSGGSPCVYSGALCTNSGSTGFIEYFKDNRIGGSGGWAAISVTPAGRIKRWFWSGSAWTD